jgi:hypothetical protein
MRGLMFWSEPTRIYRGRAELREWLNRVLEPWDSLQFKLVIPCGRHPDWASGDVPSATPVRAKRVKAARTGLRGALRRGLVRTMQAGGAVRHGHRADAGRDGGADGRAQPERRA